MALALAQSLVVQRRIVTPADLKGAAWAIDGLGALSHQMARYTVRALGIAEDAIDWREIGPPPERIERLLAGEIDATLIRVEEAMSLGRAHAAAIHTLLGAGDLKGLVPIQPHGVLSTTEAYARDHGEELARLARGMIRASRALNEDFGPFHAAFQGHVTVPVSDRDIRAIWLAERDAGGFAVNGGMGREHWQRQLDSYAAIEPAAAEIACHELLADGFVRDALDAIGVHGADFDPPPP